MSSGSERHLAAMYETYAQARAARDKLAGAGIASGDMDILDREAEPTDASFRYEHTDEGFWGAIKRFFVPDEDASVYAEGVHRGHAMLCVHPKAEQLKTAIDVLEDSGPIDLEAREQQWRSAGWSGTPAGRPSQQAIPPSGAPAGGAEQVIPVVQEQLRVGKREMRAGHVSVRSYVVEEPAHEQVRLREENVRVEHRKVDRPVGADDAFRERTVKVTATREEPVISKDARVVEEVAVRKDAGERTQQVDDKVRRTEVEVDDGHGPAQRSAGRGAAGTGDGSAPGASKK
jgi:uncharacterized protein (TIGR02271 family)